MNLGPASLIACESVLDPILEQLTTVLDEHSANFEFERSYTQKLWIRVKRKAAYLPG